MKGMGIFISALLVIDTFFASYYIGMHSHTVSVVDPSLNPFVPAPLVVAPVTKAPAAVPSAKKAPAAAKKTVGAGLVPKAARASRSDAELPYLPGSRVAKTTAKTTIKAIAKSTAKPAAKTTAKPTARP